LISYVIIVKRKQANLKLNADSFKKATKIKQSRKTRKKKEKKRKTNNKTIISETCNNQK